MDPAHELWLSPISVWEAAMLADRGRITVPGDVDGWLRRALAATPARTAELSHEVALRSRALAGYPGRDPADRFLVATALVDGLTLVTADAQMRAYLPLTTLW